MYAICRPDANDHIQLVTMQFMADVECIQSWDRAAAAAEEAEPGLMSDTITPHPSDTAGVAIPLASYVVGDGDKGIAEAFGKFLKRCQRHRSKNVATFKGSKKRFDQCYCSICMQF